jgi:hypothetical protein
LSLAEVDGDDSEVKNERVDERHVVLNLLLLTVGGRGELDASLDHREDVGRFLALEVLVERRTEVGGAESGGEVGEERRGPLSVRKDLELETGLERVGKAELGRDRERRKDEVVELSASRRDGVAKSVGGLTEEVGEVVKEDEEDALGSDVEGAGRLGELGATEEGREETEEGDELAKERSPSLEVERSVNIERERWRAKQTSRSGIVSNLGMKSRCETRATQLNVNPGKKRGCRVLREWL